MLRRYAPSIRDVENARSKLQRSYGNVVYDRYMVYQGGNSNKYYYTAICEDNNGVYHAVSAWGRIGYWPHMGEHGAGFHMGESSNINTALSIVEKKEKAKLKKGYNDYDVNAAEGEMMNKITDSKIAPIAAGTAVALLGYSLITGGNLLAELYSGAKQALSKAAETKKGCRTCKRSRPASQNVKQSEYSLNQINPVEVEGAEDVYASESVYPKPAVSPSYSKVKSLKMW